MKAFLSLFLIAVLFSSCASKKRIVAQVKTFPNWYNTPLISTSNTLYAVGEGENKSMAINGALSQILASLSVSLSSEFTSKKEVVKGDVQSYKVTSSQSIISKVQAIKISNYVVINEKDYGFEKYLVQVKIEKQKLFLALQREIESKFKRIESRTQESNAIKQLRVYKEDKISLKNIRDTLSLMQVLDSHFDDSLFLQKIAVIENKYTELLSKISFSLHTNKDASNLKPSLSKGLSDKNFNLYKTGSENHFKIDISSKTTHAKSYGFDLARSAISIRVKDFNGVLIGSNKISLIGQSTQGYLIAKENIAIKLSAKIEKDGISRVLGLGL